MCCFMGKTHKSNPSCSQTRKEKGSWKLRLSETQERFFSLGSWGKSSKHKNHNTTGSLEQFSLYPKIRAALSIAQNPIQVFHKTCKSQETCTRFKVNNANHLPGDFRAAPGQ